MDDVEPLGDAHVALAEGRWSDARAGFEQVIANGATGEACFGLAVASWWLGDNKSSVDQCGRAYSLFRRSADLERAAQSAVWLAIAYKANFANFSAANGWIARAERLLEPLEPGILHGWVWIARAYRNPDLNAAEALTVRAVDVARSAADVDLELVALSQLGLVRVAKGETDAGFVLIDEAMAAVLAGERSSLDTVVYTCCDMLNACELASDIERAAEWCAVADDFVGTYGCPFLYAECRIYYGSVLAAKGRWDDAERELDAGLRMTEEACPGLHARALIRLVDLRVRQGRLEDAERLLARRGAGVETEAEEALSLASYLLARGDAPAASRNLEQRLHRLEDHRTHLAIGLDLLVVACLATGDVDAGDSAARRLADLAASVGPGRLAAMASGAQGRVASARGEVAAATAHLEAALATWSRLELPYEVARTRFELARVLSDGHVDVAIDHAGRALAAFEALGASLDADRVAALLRSMGVHARAGVKGTGALTVREQEVLQLLGAGLTNPEIAERLYLSRKTASHHVSRILSKLNLRNRAEAAAFAVGGQGTAAGTDRR